VTSEIREWFEQHIGSRVVVQYAGTAKEDETAEVRTVTGVIDGIERDSVCINKGPVSAAEQAAGEGWPAIASTEIRLEIILDYRLEPAP